MIPYTFVLEPGLKIHKIYNGYWYWGRPSTGELHQDLRDITSRIRPDYKIDTHEMRKQWEVGGKKTSTLTASLGSRYLPGWQEQWTSLRSRSPYLHRNEGLHNRQ
jgi:hypothetical protein